MSKPAPFGVFSVDVLQSEYRVWERAHSSCCSCDVQRSVPHTHSWHFPRNSGQCTYIHTATIKQVQLKVTTFPSPHSQVDVHVWLVRPDLWCATLWISASVLQERKEWIGYKHRLVSAMEVCRTVDTVDQLSLAPFLCIKVLLRKQKSQRFLLESMILAL